MLAGPLERSGRGYSYEHTEPGSLIHVDIKKLGGIPTGGGWWAHGRGITKALASKRTGPGTGRLGHSYLHAVLDDRSRLAYPRRRESRHCRGVVATRSRILRPRRRRSAKLHADKAYDVAELYLWVRRRGWPCASPARASTLRLTLAAARKTCHYVNICSITWVSGESNFLAGLRSSGRAGRCSAWRPRRSRWDRTTARAFAVRCSRPRSPDRATPGHRRPGTQLSLHGCERLKTARYAVSVLALGHTSPST